MHVCLHLHLGALQETPTGPLVDPLPALRTIKALLEPLGMLLLPMGVGARRFVSQTLRPRFDSQLPRTLDALDAVLADDDDDSDHGAGSAAAAAAAQVYSVIIVPPYTVLHPNAPQRMERCALFV